MVLSAGVNSFKQEKILKLQKKANRIICSSDYLFHTEPLFRKLNVLKLMVCLSFNC